MQRSLPNWTESDTRASFLADGGMDAKAAEAAQSAYYNPANPNYAYAPPPPGFFQAGGAAAVSVTCIPFWQTFEGEGKRHYVAHAGRRLVPCTRRNWKGTNWA